MPSRLISKAKSSYVEFHGRAAFKIRAAAMVGIVAFPAYYLIWEYAFPQPYESITLRATGTILCSLLALGPVWPNLLKRYFLLYSYIALMLCLPTFFTAMLLLNQASPVWLMSAMAAVMFTVLLYDHINTWIVGLIGSVLGVLIFWLIAGLQPLPTGYFASLPVFMFAVAAVKFLSFSERVVLEEKLSAANFLASNIAHEMRTPLAGIKLDSETIAHQLTALYKMSDSPGDAANLQTLLAQQKPSVVGSLRRIQEHTDAANLVINLLLVNVSQGRSSPSEFSVHSMQKVVDDAVSRYHFKSSQRQTLQIKIENDFTFAGSDILMIHVLFNLLKNGHRAIDAKGSGSITIKITRREAGNRLIFHDSGIGVKQELLPYIFLPFRTGSKNHEGSGIGLSFCKLVVESFGGEITCQSNVDDGTTFTIQLPAVTTQPQDSQIDAATSTT